MLLIPHFVAPSPIHGLGCFSSVDVKKGERIWEFNPIIDRIITAADLAECPEHIVSLIYNHSEFFPSTSSFVMGADGDCFVNHSDDPNCEDFVDYVLARRDIHVGDEITCDYKVTKVFGYMLE